MFPVDKQMLVDRLLAFQSKVRRQVIESRNTGGLHAVNRATAADTIYQIDTVVEPLLEDFCHELSRAVPLVLIAEGIESPAQHRGSNQQASDKHGADEHAKDRGEACVEGMKVFPQGAAESDAKIRLIVDPIDGTRGLMYDKRAAWVLSGVAPNNGPGTSLRDIEVAVMTELPTSKMGQADALFAIKGKGAQARRVTLADLSEAPLALSPSNATGIDHGFASISNFFPGTKVLAGELMEHLARQLIGPADVTQATVFEDQYISTAGQFYELMIGHDRFNADLRPLF
jgi:hypothetical protein